MRQNNLLKRVDHMNLQPTDLVQQLAILDRQVASTINIKLKPFGLTANNYFYLLKLKDNPNIISSDFNRLVQLNQSSVTRAINSLVEDGLVIKSVSEHDRRSDHLQLTETGLLIAEQAERVINELNHDLNIQTKQRYLYDMIAKAQTVLKKM